MSAVVLCIYLMIILYDFYHNFFPISQESKNSKVKDIHTPAFTLWSLYMMSTYSILTTSTTNKHTLPEVIEDHADVRHWESVKSVRLVWKKKKKKSLIQAQKDSSSLETNTQDCPRNYQKSLFTLRKEIWKGEYLRNGNCYSLGITRPPSIKTLSNMLMRLVL